MIEDIVKINDFKNASTVEIKQGNNSDAVNKKAEKTDSTEDVITYDNKRVKEAIDHVVSAANNYNHKIKLEVDNDIMIVKVIDEETGEVIRQIPPEELVALSKHAKDLKGLLINKEG
jgi:flagellar protein FlaG